MTNSFNAQTVWIALDLPGKISRCNDPQRKEIRSKAARASVMARKATIARKAAAHRQDREPPVIDAIATTSTTQMLRNRSMASKALETQLWSQILHSTDLFATALFAISTGTNTRGVYGLEGPSQPCAVFLRGIAMRCMQVQTSMLNASSFPAPSTLTICFGALAGWEKLHGDPATYQIHLSGLKAIRSIDDGEIIEDQYNSHIASNDSLAIAPNLDTMRTRAVNTKAHRMQVLDYKIYNLHRPETRTLLLLLDRLANYSLIAANAWPSMHELSLLTFAWRPRRAPPGAWASRAASDNLEDLALYHIRAAMISVQGAWTLAVGKANPTDENFFRASDSMDEHYLENQMLETEILFGSKFEEAALWSLFILTASATPSLWRRRSIDILRSLIESPQIEADNFEQLESLLRKYAYREVVHKSVCRALYQTVVQGYPMVNPVALRDLNWELG